MIKLHFSGKKAEKLFILPLKPHLFITEFEYTFIHCKLCIRPTNADPLQTLYRKLLEWLNPLPFLLFLPVDPLALVYP